TTVVSTNRSTTRAEHVFDGFQHSAPSDLMRLPKGSTAPCAIPRATGLGMSAARSNNQCLTSPSITPEKGVNHRSTPLGRTPLASNPYSHAVLPAAAKPEAPKGPKPQRRAAKYNSLPNAEWPTALMYQASPSHSKGRAPTSHLGGDVKAAS